MPKMILGEEDPAAEEVEANDDEDGVVDGEDVVVDDEDVGVADEEEDEVKD